MPQALCSRTALHLVLATALSLVADGRGTAGVTSVAGIRQFPINNAVQAGGQSADDTRPEDKNWQANGDVTVERTRASHLRAAAAEQRAENAAGAAVKVTEAVPGLVPQAAPAADKAAASLQEATVWQSKTKALLGDLQQRAYKLARSAADLEVDHLEMEAAAYFGSLVSKLRALSDPPKQQYDVQGQAATRASQPYLQAKEKVQDLVSFYDQQALKLATEAQTLGAQGAALAKLARSEQAKGSTANAQQHIAQAQHMIKVAHAKKKKAVEMRKLTESLNMYLPSYTQAAEAAAERAVTILAGK